MKIKKDVSASTDDFWYDLTEGGYVRPEELCENPEDVEKIKEALVVIEDFHQSCIKQIEGFIQ